MTGEPPPWKSGRVVTTTRVPDASSDIAIVTLTALPSKFMDVSTCSVPPSHFVFEI